jgi:hypothetical protein
MLTADLNQKIEDSGMSASEKLVARVAIATLGTMQQVAAKVGKPIDKIQPDDVVAALIETKA